MGASRRIEALFLPASDLAPTSLSCFPEMSAGGLMQELHWVVRDCGAIAKDRGLNVIFLNKLADPLGIELLKL